MCGSITWSWETCFWTESWSIFGPFVYNYLCILDMELTNLVKWEISMLQILIKFKVYTPIKISEPFSKRNSQVNQTMVAIQQFWLTFWQHSHKICRCIIQFMQMSPFTAHKVLQEFLTVFAIYQYGFSYSLTYSMSAKSKRFCIGFGHTSSKRLISCYCDQPDILMIHHSFFARQCSFRATTAQPPNTSSSPFLRL